MYIMYSGSSEWYIYSMRTGYNINSTSVIDIVPFYNNYAYFKSFHLVYCGHLLMGQPLLVTI